MRSAFCAVSLDTTNTSLLQRLLGQIETRGTGFVDRSRARFKKDRFSSVFFVGVNYVNREIDAFSVVKTKTFKSELHNLVVWSLMFTSKIVLNENVFNYNNSSPASY